MKRLLQLRNKKYQKGGFTLVELIVVLVILAILAALLVPALTGYIDKAKEKQGDRRDPFSADSGADGGVGAVCFQ